MITMLARARRRRGGRPSDEGSTGVEVVILAPALALFLGLIIAGGRLAVAGFATPAGTPASVGATVTCQVSLADTLPGLPGSLDVTATVRSALDTYRER